MLHKQTFIVFEKAKCVDTDEEEMKSFISMHVLMGIAKFPSYLDYWNRMLGYPCIADVMPRNRFSELRRYLHFVDNNAPHDNGDKLFKISPIIEAVRKECMKIEPEEYQSVDEQIIPSRTKHSKIRQYNPKKTTKWGFKNQVRAGSSGFLYNFFLYAGKEGQQTNARYKSLQKSAQVVAKLAENLPKHQNHKLFFDNWYSTLELFHYLQNIRLWAVGTVRENRLLDCPIEKDKVLQNMGRGAHDEVVDYNSGLVIVIVHPYRIEVKTKRWYMKVFWHLIDLTKVNAWILYKHHQNQLGVQKKKIVPLKLFSIEIAESLIHLMKKNAPSKGRPSKQLSNELEENRNRAKKAVKPTPYPAIRLDKCNHWPVSIDVKQRCCLCQSYTRMSCEKCNGIPLCLFGRRNCFKDFHTLS